MDDTIVSGMSDVNSTTTMNTTTTNLTSPLEKGSCKDSALESTTIATIASNDVLKSSPFKSERYEKDVSPILTTTSTTSHNDSRHLQTNKEDKISVSSSPSTYQKAASVSVSPIDKQIHDVSGTTKGRRDLEVFTVNTIDYPPSNGPFGTYSDTSSTASETKEAKAQHKRKGTPIQ